MSIPEPFPTVRVSSNGALPISRSDEWVDAHAPKQENPFKPTMDNIMDGSMVYDKHCALCHGSLKEPVSPMKTRFYPPVPQLMNHTPDDPDANLFYVTKYGVKMTGNARMGRRAFRRRHLEGRAVHQELQPDERHPCTAIGKPAMTGPRSSFFGLSECF